VLMVQGVILFFALAGELLVNYRIEWRRGGPTAAQTEPSESELKAAAAGASGEHVL
jgi:hypothetical protein